MRWTNDGYGYRTNNVGSLIGICWGNGEIFMGMIQHFDTLVSVKIAWSTILDKPSYLGQTHIDGEWLDMDKISIG